jgi:hypothetical protein
VERIAKGSISTLRANQTDVLKLAFGPGMFQKWSLHVVPIDSGGHGAVNESTVTVLYNVGGTYYPTNPATTISPISNKDTVKNFDDQVGGIELSFANGANPPDGGALVEIWASRSGAL